MKRTGCFILIIAIVFSVFPLFVFAEEKEEYISVNVEYSDNIGTMEQLELMVKDSHVYVNAEKLARRFGYKVRSDADSVVIYNTDNEMLPYGVTCFYYGTTKVSQSVYTQLSDAYESPYPSIKNDRGCWIPFDYSLIMLNSGMLLTDNCILIDIPTKDIIDYYYDAYKNWQKYVFEWNKDFGYTEKDMKLLVSSSHVVNLFNGLLDLEGASWGALFDLFAWNSSSYDKKYSEQIAMLLCTESDAELEATIDKMQLYQNVFDEDGQLGKILSNYSKSLDEEVGVLYGKCENFLEKVKTENLPTSTYNKSYQALENALDKQTWFSHTGGNIIEFQKGLSDVSGALDVLLKVSEVVGYGTEFLNHDEFSRNALSDYLDTSTNTNEFAGDMGKSMRNYSDLLAGNIVNYSAYRLFNENVCGWIADGISLGVQENIPLFAWNIASNVVPFIANGIEGADKFELALYAQCFQSDAWINHTNIRNAVFENIETLSPRKLYQVSQYCYVYLKSCYITRNAALGSLAAKRKSVKEKIQPLIEYQNSINREIAEIMVAIKTANETNDGNVYGFLPSDNADYLSSYNDERLYSWIQNFKNRVLDLTPYLDNIDAFYSAVGGEYSSETGDHENWIIGNEIQYGNYFESSSVDEISVSGNDYKMFGICIGMNIDEAEGYLSEWEPDPLNENAAYGAREYHNGSKHIWFRFEDNETISSFGFWRDILSEENSLAFYEILDETEKNTNEAVINIKNMLSPSDKHVSLVTITLNNGAVIEQLYDEDFEGIGCQWWAEAETSDLTGDGVKEIILSLDVYGSTYGASYIYVYQVTDSGLNVLLELNDDGVDKIIDSLTYPIDEIDKISNCLNTCSWIEISGSKLIVYGNVNDMGYDTVTFIFDGNGNWRLEERDE